MRMAKLTSCTSGGQYHWVSEFAYDYFLISGQKRC